MRFYTAAEIEGISRRVYKEYKKTPGYTEMPERVIPEQLAELLGLTFDYRHLSPDRLTLGVTSFEDGDGVEVFDSPDEDFYTLDGKTMLIETDLLNNENTIGRCNFTKTHEVCHHILHLLFPADFGGEPAERRVLHYRLDGRRSRETDLMELVVDLTASAVLMPEQLVKTSMQSHGLPERIDLLNRLRGGRDYPNFCAMAADMGVSKQALAIRLKRLGLLGKEYLKHPYEMLNIYMEDEENG